MKLGKQRRKLLDKTSELLHKKNSMEGGHEALQRNEKKAAGWSCVRGAGIWGHNFPAMDTIYLQ